MLDLPPTRGACAEAIPFNGQTTPSMSVNTSTGPAAIGTHPRTPASTVNGHSLPVHVSRVTAAEFRPVFTIAGPASAAGAVRSTAARRRASSARHRLDARSFPSRVRRPTGVVDSTFDTVSDATISPFGGLSRTAVTRRTMRHANPAKMRSCLLMSGLHAPTRPATGSGHRVGCDTRRTCTGADSRLFPAGAGVLVSGRPGVGPRASCVAGSGYSGRDGRVNSPI